LESGIRADSTHPSEALTSQSPFAAQSPLPAPARFLIPSVTDLVFVLLLISLSTGSLARRLLGDGGTGWHIRTGQLILSTHIIPHSDPFSVSTIDRSWYAWEWLYDGVLAGFYNVGGLNGVVFFAAGLIAASFAVLFRLLLRRGTSMPVAVLLLLLAVSASTIHFFARPHVASWILTVCWFALLDDSERTGETRRLWWLPLLMLLWVNVHGGFLVGFVLLGIYCATASRELLNPARRLQRIPSRARTLAWVSVLSAAATFVNPYGYRLHLHIYRYLTNRFLIDHIDEFLSPNFHGIAQTCFAVILMITLAAVVVSPRRPRFSEVLIVLFAAYTALFASRNIPVAAMLLVLVSGPMISIALQSGAGNAQIPARVRSAFLREESFAARMARMEFSLRGHGLPLAVIAMGSWICLHNGQLAGKPILNAAFDPKRFPVGSVDFLVHRGITEPIFSTDAWGGYLIYRLYPQGRVVVDDRHDLYGEDFLKRYLKILRVEPGWEEALAGMHADWVLAPHGSALANILRLAGGWRAMYEDETSELFQRVGKLMLSDTCNECKRDIAPLMNQETHPPQLRFAFRHTPLIFSKTIVEPCPQREPHQKL
jgi:hypothetical protein